MTFLNIEQQSDNNDRITLEELSFLLPIFWMKMFFINLSKWSAKRAGIAQLTQRRMSQDAPLAKAELRMTDSAHSRHPGKESQQASDGIPPRLLPEYSCGH